MRPSACALRVPIARSKPTPPSCWARTVVTRLGWLEFAGYIARCERRRAEAALAARIPRA